MSRYTYPHSISNGHGEVSTFSRRVPTPTGDRLEGNVVVQAHCGPPMHVHHLQDEGLTVRSGRIAYQRLGEAPSFAGPGETIVFKRGEVHRFWNPGPEPLYCDSFVEPALNMEYFLGAVFESAKRGTTGRPGTFDAAYLLTRYHSEFDMMVIPRPVKRLLFPLVVFIGKLLGKYERYADAPTPIPAS